MGVKMTEVEYDSVVIRAYAATLYKRAESMVTWATLGGIVWGVLLSGVVAAVGSAKPEYLPGVPDTRNGQGILIMMAVLSGGIGAWRRSVAQSKAWMLRLEAQKALCQVRIEENTRPRT